jgi:flagellar basal-body rod modification protein FlgD
MPGSTVSALNSAGASPTSTSTSATASSSSTLGQTDFLKLLMAQMTNQNPLDPVSGTEFVTQLSQFSALQGIQQMNASFANLLTLQSLTEGANLLGKKISFQQTGSNAIATGTVQSVSLQGGTLQLVVGGKTVAASQVLGIQPGTAAN